MSTAMFFIPKMIGKVLMLPVIAVLIILQWISTLVVSISALLFDLVGGVYIIAGVLSFAFGQEPSGVMWKMVVTGIGICLLPQIGKWIAVQIAYLKLLAKTWLVS